MKCPICGSTISDFDGLYETNGYHGLIRIRLGNNFVALHLSCRGTEFSIYAYDLTRVGS